MDDMTVKAKQATTPQTLALELKGFAQGLEAVAMQLETGLAHEATKEQRVEAEQAAQTLMRNAPLAVRSIHRLEDFAERMIERNSERRDEIMTSMFGPDTA